MLIPDFKMLRFANRPIAQQLNISSTADVGSGTVEASQAVNAAAKKAEVEADVLARLGDRSAGVAQAVDDHEVDVIFKTGVSK